MAAGATYEPINTITTAGSANSVTFSSIPQTYTDLVLVANYGTAANGQYVTLRVGNGSVDTGLNYSATYMGGGPGGYSSSRNSGVNSLYLGYVCDTSSSLISTSIINIFYYTSTERKSILTRTGNPNLGTDAFVQRWGSNSTINIITLTTPSTTFLNDSTFTLYGIKAA